MKNIIFIFILLFFSSRSFSEQTAVLEFITDLASAKGVKVEYFKSWVNSNRDFVVFESETINNKIELNFILDSPTEVRITYNERLIYAFVKPGDSVLVNYKDGEFIFPNSKDCEFLNKYKLIQEANSSDKLKEIDPKDYLKILEKRRQLTLNLLTQAKASISSPCYSYYSYDSFFRQAYDKLFFRRFQQADKLGAGYFNFLNEIPLNLDSPSRIPYYGSFLNEYLLYTQAKSKKAVNAFDIIFKRSRVKQYKFLPSIFQGQTLEYMRSMVISKAFYEKEHYASIYRHFKKTYPHSKFTSNLLLQKDGTERISVNKLPPQFILEDQNGEQVSLASFKGRIVYLIFWGTYCAPCIQSFPTLKKLQTEFKDREVSFIYISLDNNKDIWKKSIYKYQLEGIQLNADYSKMSSLFNFLSIPHYILINKKGEISGFQHPSNPLLELKLKKLLF